MTPATGELSLTRLETVVFGPGRIAGLGQALRLRGSERALIVTTPSVGRSALQGAWDTERLTHRGQCQIGAWCSLYGGFNTRVSDSPTRWVIRSVRCGTFPTA